MNGVAPAPAQTITALKRWSCQDKQLPPVDQIKQIHVYDFDNTRMCRALAQTSLHKADPKTGRVVFASPLPNKQLWYGSYVGQLQAQDFLHNGGWWHNVRILAATGQGIEVEESRAWQGFWNEKIVELAKLSMQDEATLNVLLTGRMESRFAETIGRMVASKGLEFDMMCLKPAVGPSGETFASTMLFKQALLRDIIITYAQANEIRIYEDRPKHVKGFKDFFFALNTDFASRLDAPRSQITAEVIHVMDQETVMDPVSEVAEVQNMINVHNRAVLDGTAPRNSVPYKIKRSVFYTGYIISPDDSTRLVTLLKLPANIPDHEIRMLANNILITPRPAPHSILKKVGGIGAKLIWRVTGIGHFENRIWAARVEPAIPGATIHTENKPAFVVLATKRQTKPVEATRIQNWQPVPEHQAFEFVTTVGEKVMLRIEEEFAGEDPYEASFPNNKNARKHPRDDEFPQLDSNRSKQQQRQLQSGGNTSWANKVGGGIGFAAQRGGGTAGRGNRGSAQRGYRRGNVAGSRGRGRGGYRSLDDNVGQGYGGGGMQY